MRGEINGSTVEEPCKTAGHGHQQDYREQSSNRAGDADAGESAHHRFQHEGQEHGNQRGDQDKLEQINQPNDRDHRHHDLRHRSRFNGSLQNFRFLLQIRGEGVGLDASLFWRHDRLVWVCDNGHLRQAGSRLWRRCH